MPINYYCTISMNGSNIDLNKNQLIEPVIENAASAPGSPVEGQMYYDTTNGDKTMYFYNGTSWVEMDGSGSGVISLTPTDGTFIDITQNGTTGAITTTADLSASGTASGTTFLRGDNTWATPAGAYTDWNVAADSGTTQDVIDGNTVNFVGDTNGGILTKVDTSITNAAVLFQLDVNDLSTFTGPATGDFIAVADITDSGNTKKVTIANILALAPQGDITGLTEGSGITITNGSGPVPTIAIDYLGANNAVLSAADGTGVTLADADDFLFSDDDDSNLKYGNLSQLKTYIDGRNETLAQTLDNGNVTGGTDISVSAGDDLLLTDTSQIIMDSDFKIYKNIGNNSIVSETGTGDLMLMSDNSVKISSGELGETYALFEKDGSVELYEDNTKRFETTTSGIAVTGQATSTTSTSGGDNDKTLTTKDYVDGLVTGGLTFKGTFNATTGAIVSGGSGYLYQLSGSAFDPSAARVAVAVGDYWVVSTAGNFYGSSGTGTCATTQALDIGDSVIGVSAASANASVCSDWSIVQSDEGVTDITSTDANTSTGEAITVNTNATGSVILNLFEYDGGNNVGYVPKGGGGSSFLRGDGTWVVPTDTGVTGVTLATGTSSGAPLTESISSRELTITSMAYAGTTNIGYVPTGGSATTFLRGDGSWVTPTDSTPVDSVSTTTAGTSSGDAITISPTTGTVLVKPMAYAGGANVGHVPSGGGSTTFLRGDGSWVVPTDSTPVDSVTASSAAALRGLSSTPTTGAVVVGLDIANTGTISAAIELDDYMMVYDDSASGNGKSTVGSIISAGTYAVTITGFGTVTHNLGTYDVIVQLYDDTTKETVTACVDRATTNTVAISGNSFPAGDIRVLVSKCS